MKKPHENILVFSILYKILINAKPMSIRFDKVNGFIRVYDGTTYPTLFELINYRAASSKIRYFTGVKSGITLLTFHSYEKKKKVDHRILCLWKNVDIS